MKFLKNGIKSDTGKYFPVFYSRSALKRFPPGTITIYARNYDHLPEDLLPENKTDMYTDYFEKDLARITPESSFWPELNAKLLLWQVQDAKRARRGY